MATPAQSIINLAFRQLIKDCLPDYVKIKEEHMTWEDGEAEAWLKDIADGIVHLSYAYNDDGTVSPCTRS